MWLWKRSYLIVWSLVFGLTGSALAAESPSVAQLWDDFNHYILIARPELAAAAAEAIIKTADPQDLLDAVEASRFSSYDQTLAKALKMEPVRAAAEALDQVIQKAQVQRVRDPQRIAQAIVRLGEGQRANMRANALLREAGAFAAPQLLQSLQNPQQVTLRPYVLAAIVQTGKPLVYPLGESLSHLDPATLRMVAQALAEIGYSQALPYLKELSEKADLDPLARQAAEVAFLKIATDTKTDGNATAAELFLTLALNYYDRVSRDEEVPGFDARTKSGVVWEYSKTAGLVEIQVPASIFGDVLAMRAARRALALNPSLDQALSLWLASNQRRANRLASGETDPTYHDPQPPTYYLKMAGPNRQADVLARALADHDSDLARNAIAALDETAGTATLVSGGQALEPLLDAMGFPDRRVRYEAAFALAKARPEKTYTSSFRVVPALSDAVRQTHEQRALVVAPEADLNLLIAVARGLGYNPIAAGSLAAAADEIEAVAGVDLILAAVDPQATATLRREAREHFKLRTAPLVAAANAVDLPETNRLLGQFADVIITTKTTESQELQDAIGPSLAALAGKEVSEEEALHYALTSLGLLKEIALERGNVYGINDAKPALLDAMKDAREPVVVATAQVLALLNDPVAQRTLAEIALDAAQPENLRIAMLGSLGQSAEYFGNLLTPSQIDRLLELVKQDSSDLSMAAARVHGALALPTANLVQMLNQ
ncbi:MAG: hypothetical protein IT443_10340 [Phycisphaeraceae bacterium]|nr:hypothetical protein [Phycisphaeraceae bacterium]